jgi:hypothetical protein
MPNWIPNINPKMGGLVLCSNGSDLIIGAMVMQGGQIIAYGSRKLSPIELNYPTHEKELLVVIHVLKIWNQYLLGTQFTIETNHETFGYHLT